MRLDVLVAGELYVDVILSGFDEWPQPGRESFAKSLRREIGGGVSITACGLAKLGIRAGVLGVIGSDAAEWLCGELAKSGVDASGIAVDAEEPTGLTVVATTQADRAFLSYAGANQRLTARLLQRDWAASARHVHLACAPEAEVLRAVADAVHASGGSVSVDAGWHEDWLTDAEVAAALGEVDIFFPNEAEARCMTGESDPERMLHWFEKAGLRHVALKLGANGSAALVNGEAVFAAAPVVSSVDTTGAGDCFDAGFLYAMLNAMPPEACLRAGNICGGRSTEAYGGIAGFPTLARMREELESGCEK